MKWRSNEKMPSIMESNLKMISGERYARRPSAIAKKSNKRRSSDVLEAEEYVGNRSDWVTTDDMPDEDRGEDVGWKPGPCDRELPPFLNYTNAILARGVSFRRRFCAPLALARVLSSPSCGEAASLVGSASAAARSPQPSMALHTVIDTAELAKADHRRCVEEAYAQRDRRGRPPNIPRVHPKRGVCGEYDSNGKFQKCGLAHYSERSTLFCVQCKRYYHLPCLWTTHACHFKQ